MSQLLTFFQRFEAPWPADAELLVLNCPSQDLAQLITSQQPSAQFVSHLAYQPHFSAVALTQLFQGHVAASNILLFMPKEKALAEMLI
ncbi:MAG: hypothetical protein SVC26_08265, partial [Pseudomonadota bacterium]|nr:hypothetical protein [Pseudomonadota bacterium]